MISRDLKEFFDEFNFVIPEEETEGRFIYDADPVLYMQFMGYIRAYFYPCVGNKVITLRGGFGKSAAGRILTVVGVDADEIHLVSDAGQIYILSKVKWYSSIFEIGRV